MAKGLKAPRVSGADLVRAIAPATTGLPAATAAPPVRLAAARTMQVNFRASEGMAKALAKMAVEHGSVRRAIAAMMRDAGIEVPEEDFAPPPGRRRLG
jgi:hypothetical protein